MRLAIATDNKKVSEHFGHAQGFMIYDSIDNSKKYLDNPGHRPGYIPMYLNEKKIDVIIVGGIGGAAIDIFKANNIDVITGASGDIDEIYGKYINKTLISSKTVCHEHKHHCED